MAQPRPSNFDTKRARDKQQLEDALGQRVRPMGPPPNQQQPSVQGGAGPMMMPVPSGAPNPGAPFGAPPTTPQRMVPQFMGMQGGVQGQVGPATLGVNAQTGPNGAPQGFGVGAGMPVAGGGLSVNANLDNAARLQQLQAQYQRGPFSVRGGYSPQGGANVGASYRQQFAEGGGVWTRKEGQDPEGGLNAKGRASLKAQGQDVKPPVSAKQAKKSPKAAARRSSFCARMTGVEGPMEDEKGRPTRKALALRKWDC